MITQRIQLYECGYQSVAKDAALVSPQSNQQLVLHSVAAYNGSASTMAIGLGARFSNIAWKVHSIQAGISDITADVQAGVASTLFPTTDTYGFLVQCKDRFGLISLTISQAQAGTPVYVYEYYNGSGWSTLTTRNTPVYSAAASIAIAFAPPIDWVQGNGSVVGDLNSGEGYCIRIKASTAPSTAVQVTAMHVSRFFVYRTVGAKAAVGLDFEVMPAMLEVGEAVQPYFEVAHAQNAIEVGYQVGG